MNTTDQLVILVRLNSSDGFASFADALNVVGQLQSEGVSAIVEQSPGALMDSQDSYLLKVPQSQYDLAQEKLKEILKR